MPTSWTIWVLVAAGGWMVYKALQSKDSWREFIKSLLQAGVIALCVRTYVIQAYKIPSSSMEETLKPGDHIFVNKFLYGIRIPFTEVRFLAWRDPHRKDVMVFQAPHEPTRDYIKRCIGLPGESVRIENKAVGVNGVPLEEPYTRYVERVDDRETFHALPDPIPAKSFFMMGDNRDNSKDSRYWGYLPMRNVKGKALLIYWPPSRFGIIR